MAERDLSYIRNFEPPQVYSPGMKMDEPRIGPELPPTRRREIFAKSPVLFVFTEPYFQQHSVPRINILSNLKRDLATNLDERFGESWKTTLKNAYDPYTTEVVDGNHSFETPGYTAETLFMAGYELGSEADINFMLPEIMINVSPYSPFDSGSKSLNLSQEVMKMMSAGARLKMENPEQGGIRKER